MIMATAAAAVYIITADCMDDKSAGAAVGAVVGSGFPIVRYVVEDDG